jgi:sigma-B regulation protein RsbU (phosphoserine phosphatase)
MPRTGSAVNPKKGESRLTWKSHDGQRQSFVIASPEALIGRKTDCDLVISNRNVSRHHAKLVSGPSGFELVDLDSSYGTFVNGESVKRHVLRHGDRIAFGKHEIDFEFREDDAARTDDTTRIIQKAVGDFSQILPSAASDLEKILYVLDFQHQWNQAFTPERGLEQILESAVKISGAERAFIMTRDGVDFRFATGLDGRGRRLDESEFGASQSAVREVVNHGRPVFMVEGFDSDFASQQSILAMNLRALACLPLRGLPTDGDAPEILGILYLDSTKAMHSLSGLDEKILTKLAVEASNVLEHIEMVKAIDQRRQIERDLALAEETQRSLLPRELPELPHLKLRAFSRPTRYVGGDFYHFQVQATGELIGLLADVSGKGVAASLVSSMLLGSIQLLLNTGCSQEDALKQLNTFFCEKSANQFATMFLFSTAADGTGHFVSAGHNPAYLFRKASNTLEELSSTGLILGAFDFATFTPSPLTLQTGDVLLVYSDGLTEAENAAGELLGEERVKNIMQTLAPSGADRVQNALLSAVNDFTEGRHQTDDITIVIAERV